MKKCIFTLSFIICSYVFGFSQFHFGAGLQLISEGTDFGGQGKAVYEINDNFDVAGTFTYHFGNTPDWTIDLDAHYTILELSDNFHISPLAGLSYSKDVADMGEVKNKLGLNLGGILDFIAGEKERHVYIEPKVIIGGVKSFVIAGGILL